MFKVICIKGDELKEVYNRNDITPKLIEGNEYNVVGEETVKGYLFYELAELPPIINNFSINPLYFNAARFIPLSEIDELQLVNEKQLVNQ